MKATLAYLTMVGLPLLGLLVILDAGKGLPAPRSIGGEWTVRLARTDGAASCPLHADSVLRLTVAQSGRRAELRLSADSATIPLHAKVQPNFLSSWADEDVSGGCAGASLDLHWVGGSPVREARGAFQGCDGCARVPVVAERAR